MFNIIKSDLYRLVKSKGFYIVIGVVIIMAIISVISMSEGHIGLSVGSSVDVTDAETLSKISSAKSLGEFRDIMKSFGAFKLDRKIIGQNVNLYYMFIVFVVIILTKDFSNKSIYVYAVYENGSREFVEKYTHDSEWIMWNYGNIK